MKYSNGTYKEWAQNEEDRQQLQDAVLHAYYVFYAIILTFAFLVLPMAFFFNITSENEGNKDNY